MSLILKHYENDLEKAWYDSSNILYSECDDKDGELKVVRIVFKGGRTYQYTDVKVNDYLMFRENISQGKALNTFMKQYPTERVGDTDVASINEELEIRQNNGFLVVLDESNINVFNNENKVLKMPCKVLNETSNIITLLEALNVKYKNNEKNSN